jgi:RNA polymerase sigma-70 factor (ECF subfamily)
VEADDELYHAWAAGDRSAGDALCGRYYDRLYRFFANKVAAGAEDLVQETLVGLLEAHARFEGRASLRTFVYAIARNVLRNDIDRGNRGRIDPDFSVHSIAQLCPTPSSMAARNETAERLDAALRTLPVDHQIALELHYWDGLSGPEIAEVLALTLPATRSRLRRAKAALEKALGDGVIELPTGPRDG